jgi:carbamoylphosphate synthase small subunit
MAEANANLGRRLIDAVRAQGFMTALIFIASIAGAVDAEAARRRANPNSTDFWGTVKNSQILLLLTAALSLIAVVKGEVERRTRQVEGTTIDAGLQKAEQTEVPQ